MSDELRAVLTEDQRASILSRAAAALQEAEHQSGGGFLGYRALAEAALDVTLDALASLPGVAVIQLPEPEVIQGEPRWNDGNVWTGGSGKVRAYLGDARMTAASARELAADLLAAAVVAEGEDNHG